MVWGFCVYFVYMIPLETDVLRKHRFQKLITDILSLIHKILVRITHSESYDQLVLLYLGLSLHSSIFQSVIFLHCS